MKGLLEIFYEPGKVFDEVRERGSWVVPFVAGIILFVAMFAYINQSIGAGNITRHALEDSKFAAQMPADAKEKAIADSETPGGQLRSLSFGTIGYVVVMLFFVLVSMGIAAMFGGKMRFAQGMGMVFYASWPFTVVRFILSAVIIMIATDKANLDAQHLLAFNLGAFLDKANTAKPLYALASSFDIFIFAQIALAAYGLSKVAMISFTKALIGFGLLWLLLTLAGMAFSLVM